ncbi:hypothetical protein FEM48_Zijuj04G0155500 [Ziziphus jujuba var. spinosa]|uniref:Uncharacterized protein n=1 Tax=Ziziphus jujuba var. spinosa TaxID=714518 RepID=A0A978VKP4_ZIZJJ|nr:hypothetical protein FEM48_Zijuj04G0155500 [Ziziphus jujuba var. spinosa]
MDVLAALIVSEEFRGIVALETGTPKILNNVSRVESRISRSLGLNDESTPQDSNNSSERSQDKDSQTVSGTNSPYIINRLSRNFTLNTPNTNSGSQSIILQAVMEHHTSCSCF